MRLNILSGVALALAAAAAVWLGAFFGLELDHVALLGVALGAVVGLVPQGRSVHRLSGFAAGFVVAWVGYALRAAVLPDSASGRAIAVLVVVLACALVATAAWRWVPLWAPLVGVAALVAVYEETYTAAPPQFVDQSMTAATTVLLAVAVGYLVSTLFVADTGPSNGPVHEPATESAAESASESASESAQRAPRHTDDLNDTHSIDELMTESHR